jgi:hypothetical protein
MEVCLIDLRLKKMCRIGKWKIELSKIYNTAFFWRAIIYEEGRLYYKYRILWLVIEKDA